MAWVLRCAAVFILSLGSFAALAQTPPPPSAPAPALPMQPSVPVEDVPSALLNYIEPTYPNLARAYWALSIHDLDNNDSIDYFLAITECQIFKNYFKNEFEWAKVREISRKYLEQNRRYFSTRFMTVQPIMLDRYDMENTKFNILADSQYLGATRLQLSGNDYLASPCEGVRFNIPGYPHNVILTSRRPITLKSIVVQPEVAKEYIDYLAKNRIQQKEGRPAYLVFRSNLKQYAGMVKEMGETFASIHGDIESISVYGDRELTLKMFETQFQETKNSDTQPPPKTTP